MKLYLPEGRSVIPVPHLDEEMLDRVGEDEEVDALYAAFLKDFDAYNENQSLLADAQFLHSLKVIEDGGGFVTWRTSNLDALLTFLVDVPTDVIEVWEDFYGEDLIRAISDARSGNTSNALTNFIHSSRGEISHYTYGGIQAAVLNGIEAASVFGESDDVAFAFLCGYTRRKITHEMVASWKELDRIAVIRALITGTALDAIADAVSA
jgi:hypothetical protein